jgi:hypothetical protein
LTRLRQADRAYKAAITDLAQQITYRFLENYC